ncbi:unnamed protein product [Amoebophrya sp. A120]|nr:unnamed protein product [Amoebophrya sp. A120]|eukprot:GSA120T00011299001.1
MRTTSRHEKVPASRYNVGSGSGVTKKAAACSDKAATRWPQRRTTEANSLKLI